MMSLIEAAVIGTLSAGWACSTYWPGDAGLVVGLAVGFFAWATLITIRNERRIKNDSVRTD